MYNTAVREGDSNVKCGYMSDPYDFVCWTTRDVKAMNEVCIIIIIMGQAVDLSAV